MPKPTSSGSLSNSRYRISHVPYTSAPGRSPSSHLPNKSAAAAKPVGARKKEVAPNANGIRKAKSTPCRSAFTLDQSAGSAPRHHTAAMRPASRAVYAAGSEIISSPNATAAQRRGVPVEVAPVSCAAAVCRAQTFTAANRANASGATTLSPSPSRPVNTATPETAQSNPPISAPPRVNRSRSA